jgi:hypothetical protein
VRTIGWLIAICIVVAGCSRKTQQAVPEPEALADAVDSARMAVWDPDAVKGDTLHHSVFYDSVLVFIRRSVDLERQKRESGEQISTLTPLTSAHLKMKGYRHMAIDSLTNFNEHSLNIDARLDSLFAQYSLFARRTLDTLYHDTLRYQRVLPDILRRDLFSPRWRSRYDSIESSIVGRTLDVLHLIDTNAHDITFEEDLRFRNPETADQYDALRMALDSLATEESKVSRTAR